MAEHFQMSLLDPDKLVKVNNLKEITSPIFFIRDNMPNPDGLLSNEIFGITKDERANIFAYIDLAEWFLNPLCYKIWYKVDRKIRDIVHGTSKFIITKEGYLEVSPDGENGIEFLRKNIDKIKFKTTESTKRDRNIEFLTNNKDKLFIRKMIVIPAYYRDVNTSSGGRVGVGQINELYSSLLVAVKSLKESVDYGFNLSAATHGRVQEIILNIYNWFSGATKDEPGLASKYGIVRRSNLNKTTDYASRLVLSAPNLKVERAEDLVSTIDYSAVPLASVCANFYPFIIYNVRRFFENEFSGTGIYNYVDTSDGNKVKQVHIKNYQEEFSDDRIKKEIDRFLYGYSNRFIPISVPNTENIKINMGFKGYNMTAEEYAKQDPGNMPIIDRELTWCDVFYMAAVEATRDKTILITRYPIDSYYNQFPTKIKVSSTKETEPMVINNKYYDHYPKIRQEDIEQNTSNKFIDTLNLCNAYLDAIGGDYDGDQVTVKGIYSVEANKELSDFIDSKAHFINLGGSNVRVLSNEGIQSLYSLTKILSDAEDKLTDPKF